MIQFLKVVRRQAEVSAGDGKFGYIIVGGQVSSAAHAGEIIGDNDWYDWLASSFDVSLTSSRVRFLKVLSGLVSGTRLSNARPSLFHTIVNLQGGFLEGFA